MNRVGSDRPPEGETAWKSAGPDWGCWVEMGLTSGLDLQKNELGQGPLAEGGQDRGAAAATALRAAVLAPGRSNEGRNGRGRWLWTSPMLRRGRSGPHRHLISRNWGSFCGFPAKVSEFSDLQIP
ncbi:hypothetical protein CRG98_015569 [Punica granatum]|uniref:Uncharacterized protein n=1 Tax=Punica granatum TaxID=22663 RepID=A0A2I0K679_PUNGR|nr:hypothetical protein CRG98_015569 [Punica granatum]